MDHHCGVNRCPHCSEKTDEHKASDGLADYSSRDKPWDVHRAQADDVQAIYAKVEEFERYAGRIAKCSGVLRFAQAVDPETGEIRLRLREAHFCRVRHCPVCQWRRSLMWLARFYAALPEVQAQYPKARWLFLTLTVRNCPISDLRETLRGMNAAWKRLIERKEFRHVYGWLRTTEVTRGRDGSAHPHFHCLMLVPASMVAGKLYVKHERWVELWQQAARLDYAPVVDIRTVKDKAPKGEDADPLAGLRKAAAETLKYAVKPSDMVADPDWFREMTRQVHRLRYIATGGALKDVLRVDEETQEELALADDTGDGTDDGSRLAFNWRSDERRYRRFPKADKPADAGE
ncbi:Replication protein [Salmonella enterica]|nr:Replication protein [Salmonella enterica]